MKHTIGPWAYEVSFDFETNRDKLNIVGNGQIIAQGIEFTEISKGANASLLKAAPEMYDALVAMTALVDSYIDMREEKGLYTKNIKVELHKALEVMAKARGDR